MLDLVYLLCIAHPTQYLVMLLPRRFQPPLQRRLELQLCVTVLVLIDADNLPLSLDQYMVCTWMCKIFPQLDLDSETL